MDQIQDLSDERLKGACAYCGVVAGESRDHVPSKGLLRKPYPPNLPVIWACGACNNGFSTDEEYFRLFLHCVLTGTTDPDQHADEDIARGLRRQLDLRRRIERSKSEVTLSGGRERVWVPEMERVNRIVLKNARGHAYFEYGEPRHGKPLFVEAAPLDAMPENLLNVFTSKGPEVAAWPEVGSRMMTRLITGQDMMDGWIVVQDDVYRYWVDEWEGRTRVSSVLYEYIATAVLLGLS